MDNHLNPLPDKYEENVYAGWLGKCIGVHLGGPLEGWSYLAIKENIGEIKEYLQSDRKIFKPDDDLIMPLIMMSVLDGKHSPDEITAEMIGDTWRNLLSKVRGGIWRGGYGISTEHTAFLNLHHGIPAPVSGSELLNGKTVSEQIGGQIFSDIWGLVLPNDPEAAANLAEKAASVSHAGEGIFGGRFIAAMVSLAFNGRKPSLNLVQAMDVIPQNSIYAVMVRDLLNFYKNEPFEWRAARDHVEKQWGYQEFSGAVPIIPNAAIIVLALLYGEGNFSNSIKMACMGGWDTDCNVGNVGAILGVTAGLKGIEKQWRDPLRDTIVSSSIRGAKNICDIANTALFLADAGKRFTGDEVQVPRPRFHFTFDGSIQGFTSESERCKLLLVRQESARVPGCNAGLRIAVGRLDSKGFAKVFVRTHLLTSELSSNNYEASFSPSIYPGQNISAGIYLTSYKPASVQASIYIRDELRGEVYQQPGAFLKDYCLNDLHLLIPYIEDLCISEVGILIKNLGDESWSGSLLLDHLDWTGIPNYSSLLGNLPMNGKNPLGWTVYSGNWQVGQGKFTASGYEYNEAYSGGLEWDDLEMEVDLLPLRGQKHCINFRVEGGLNSYLFGFVDSMHIGFLKKIDGKYNVLCSCKYEWEIDRTYTLKARLARQRFLLYINDQQLISCTDENKPYLAGQIGLSNGPGCRTQFIKLRISSIGENEKGGDLFTLPAETP